MKSINKSYIGRNYPNEYTASGKAKIDAERIVEDCGYKNIGINRSHVKVGYKSKIKFFLTFLKSILTMPQNGYVFLQYPLSKTKLFIDFATRLNNKVIVLVHDLNSLRDLKSSHEINVLRKADVLIVHTLAMKNKLKEIGILNKIVVLEIFDYLDGGNVRSKNRDGKYRIAFAGNLGKSNFLDFISFKKNVMLNLYGIGIENRNLKEGVQYKGCFAPDKLAENMEADFGLVWDGDSNLSCTGILGDYLRIISPHKLSMYISAGIPVIVWKESAMAKFVEDNQIGLVINSLDEIEDILDHLSTSNYKEMKENSIKISLRLREGYYLKSAIKKAEIMCK